MSVRGDARLAPSFESVHEAAREILRYPQAASGRWRSPETVLLAAEVARLVDVLTRGVPLVEGK